MRYSHSIVITSIIFILFFIFSYTSASESVTIWTTDVYGNLKTDFAPGEIVYIHGQGFISNVNVDIDVTRPDSVIESGFETTDSFGEFVYGYDLNGIEGLYTVDASDGTNSAQTTFTDASVWTTDGIAQQKNAFSCNEVVGLDGDGLTASTTLEYAVKDQPSGGNNVSSGTVNTDSNGDIVFTIIWTVPQFYTLPTPGGQHKVYVYDAQAKTKTFTVTCDCVDNDGDGYYGYDLDDCPTGDDCDDTDPNINPGATEVCNNQIDDDCDDLIDCDDPDCESDPACGYCGDGTVDPGEDCDPGANDPNDCCDSNCMFETSQYICRQSAGECDPAEFCTGSSPDCPSDSKSTDLCRQAVDQCDADEYCDGINNDCPPDSFQPLSTPCDDGLWCSENDHCDGNGNCVELTARDCSGNDITEVATCNNDPDNNPFTWDFRNPSTSLCNEDTDSCTTGDDTITHECHDCDPDDGINGDLCCAPCDQDEDCEETTRCDYDNKLYCTSYGTCDDGCTCSYEEVCVPEDYCSNCNHCGDGVVNCEEECEPGQQGDRCLPEGAEIFTCLNNVSYVFPEFDTCEDDCSWNNCEQIVTPDDPRCVPLPLPTCGWGNFAQCFSFDRPSFSFERPSFNFEKPSFSFEKPTFEFNKPSFSFPTFDFSSFRR